MMGHFPLLRTDVKIAPSIAAQEQNDEWLTLRVLSGQCVIVF